MFLATDNYIEGDDSRIEIAADKNLVRIQGYNGFDRGTVWIGRDSARILAARLSILPHLEQGDIGSLTVSCRYPDHPDETPEFTRVSVSHSLAEGNFVERASIRVKLPRLLGKKQGFTFGDIRSHDMAFISGALLRAAHEAREYTERGEG